MGGGGGGHDPFDIFQSFFGGSAFGGKSAAKYEMQFSELLVVMVVFFNVLLLSGVPNVLALSQITYMSNLPCLACFLFEL